MQLWRIALRNLGRSPARTALSIAAVAASVVIVVLMKGMVAGVLDSMEESTIRLSAGHVRVIDREYEVRERLMSLQYPVDGVSGEGYRSLSAAFEEIVQVAEIAPRIRFGGMVSVDEDLRSVAVTAGDPVVEAQLMRVERNLGEGRFFRAGEREAVLGRRLLNRLNLSVGDRFTLVFNTALGGLRGYTLTVVGAFESGLTYLDDGTVFIPLDVAQQALDLGPAVTEILLMAREKRDVPEMASAVVGALDRLGVDERYTVIPWYDHSEMMAYLQVGKRVYDLIYLAILFLASFVVINTFVMIVNERRREIGMLGALGLRPRQINALFLLEGGLCGVFGSLVGTIIGTAALALLSQIGIYIPGVETVDAELMYPTRIFPILSAEVVVYALVAGIAVTFAAAYLPARQAARMPPTDALRS